LFETNIASSQFANRTAAAALFSQQLTVSSNQGDLFGNSFTATGGQFLHAEFRPANTDNSNIDVDLYLDGWDSFAKTWDSASSSTTSGSNEDKIDYDVPDNEATTYRWRLYVFSPRTSGESLNLLFKTNIAASQFGIPTISPTTESPTTRSPTESPTTRSPTQSPTKSPTQSPTTGSPTRSPTESPRTAFPTIILRTNSPSDQSSSELNATISTLSPQKSADLPLSPSSVETQKSKGAFISTTQIEIVAGSLGAFMIFGIAVYIWKRRRDACEIHTVKRQVSLESDESVSSEFSNHSTISTLMNSYAESQTSQLTTQRLLRLNQHALFRDSRESNI
jgi:hypothetical protein